MFLTLLVPRARFTKIDRGWKEKSCRMDSEETNDFTNLNEELFLKNICNYPVIFDSQSKGYSNRLLKLKAWKNVADFMDISVEICQKKWKSLREKYHREKQKAEQYYRSGSGAIAFPKWHLMSFFEFMFDKVKPRQYVLFDAIKKIGSKDLVNKQTSSSPFIETNAPDQNTSLPSTSNFHNSSTIEILSDTQDTADQVFVENSASPSTYIEINTSNRGKSKKVPTAICKRKPEIEDPMIGILGKISTSIESFERDSHTKDKISDFCNYLGSEIRDLQPPSRQEEFIDETLIRLLQVKRKKE